MLAVTRTAHADLALHLGVLRGGGEGKGAESAWILGESSCGGERKVGYSNGENLSQGRKGFMGFQMSDQIHGRGHSHGIPEMTISGHFRKNSFYKSIRALYSQVILTCVHV